MISKEVLAKVNELIAIAVTKKCVHIEFQNYTRNSGIVVFSQVSEDCSSIYPNGNVYWSDAQISLADKKALSKLEQVLEWLNTLEDAAI